MRYFFIITSVFLLMACASASNIVKDTEHDAIYGEVAYKSASLSRGGGANDFAPSQPRMVNYTGNVSLQSAEPEATIDTVVKKVAAKGGSVNNRSNGYISLQIPVAEFKEFFNYILTLGNVTSKNISASDITDAYSDNEARLRIAENTLARLQALLAVAKSEQEKIALLKEIQRVSEQIESAKLTEKELLRMAAFSTINLSVSNIPIMQPRPLNANINAFKWFEHLLGSNEHFKTKALKLNVPQGFIETENENKKWNAASAINTQFTAFEKENEPQGTPEFWAGAMLEHFKHSHKTELTSENNFSLIRLQNFNTNQEIFYIAILKNSNNKKLKIAIAKFPTAEAEKKNKEAVLETLRSAK